MTLERRQMLTAGLASLAAGGLAWPIKALLDHRTAPTLRGPLSAQPGPADLSEADLAAASTGATPAIKPSILAKIREVRRAYMHNTHTGEMLDVVYYENGRYVPGALFEAKRVLRDWRNGEQHFIHPHLFDLLHDLRAKLETKAPFQILSGYRSPATNAMLHARSEQVASRSQHLLGKALDITVEGVGLTHLHKAALSLRAGGVGYYPESGFVHVDVGPLREWVGA